MAHASPGSEARQLPWVQVATFCEDVEHDPAGNLSIRKIIGKVTIVPESSDAPVTMPEFDYRTLLVLTVVPQEGQAGMHWGLQVEGPDGRTDQGRQSWVDFEAGKRGHTLITRVVLRLRRPGLYWVNVLSGDLVLTRLPLEVAYAHPLSQTTTSPASP